MSAAAFDSARGAVPVPRRSGTAWRAWARQRALRRRQQEMAMLDDAALRDLALDRSELGSCAAESAGIACSSRRRITADGDAVGRGRSGRAGGGGWHWSTASAARRVLACLAPMAVVLAMLVTGACRSGDPRPLGWAGAPGGVASGSPDDTAAAPPYFPSQFPPPAGDAEPLPSQF